MKQHAHIKFFAKLEKTQTKTFRGIKTASGEDFISHMQVFELFHSFKDGYTSVECDKHSQHPFNKHSEHLLSSRNDSKIA
jgi:hypothetical protein